MNNLLLNLIERAKTQKQRIVLPEGNDKRVIEAASKISKLNIAHIILLGKKEEITKYSFDITNIEIIDPNVSLKKDEYAERLYKLRKHKGMTLEDAKKMVLDDTYYGVMMVYLNDADGMVSGAIHSTADTLRPALQILKTEPNTKIVSTFFIMDVPNCEYGEKGLFLFADCGLNENPSSEELSEIALSSSKSFSNLIQKEPIVAMLSYSSFGSASSSMIEKIKHATQLAKNKNDKLVIDGELQVDAAIVPSISSLKSPSSSISGYANVLIFPDLNSGNIAYKLTERLAKARAYGPITQGLSKPVNDLSRGCSSDDIVGVVTITCIQAQNR